MHYKTIVISDVHLGTKDAKTKELAQFLKVNSCDRLIINGDFIDAWNLNRRGKWNNKDTRVIRRILKMMELHNTDVIYVRGNHDDFLDKVIPVQFGKIKVVDSLELVSGGIKYFVTHGDIFDVISRQFKWIANLGDIGYKLLLWMNRRHNKIRKLKGLPYHSLSQKIKHKVKMAVSFISDFEETMVEFARHNHYQGIICGHIHQPALKLIDDIIYMNSGDWVETMSALVEDENENWEIVYYHTILIDHENLKKNP
jgi:UDP-2,3-diacylglucosamine pyrophosphatase LpxH